VHDVDIRHALEQFSGQMIGRADPRRGKIDLARLFARQRD
jgi:hypothetical protein